MLESSLGSGLAARLWFMLSGCFHLTGGGRIFGSGFFLAGLGVVFEWINVQQDIIASSGPWIVDVATESDTEGCSTYCDVLDCLDIHAARVLLGDSQQRWSVQ